MARRQIEEINAGSMADIAFLLLIFFLVTTTMEVDNGIGRTLPAKLPPSTVVPPPVIARNVLEIEANSNDKLLIEGNLTDLEDLKQIVYDFYTINRLRNDVDLNMPNYDDITISLCDQKISELQAVVNESEDNSAAAGELEKWKLRKEICNKYPSKSFREMDKASVIQLKNQAGTSYGLYIQLQDIMKTVVNELSVEICNELNLGDYLKLDPEVEADQKIIKMVRILVPERIIEAKIDR
jgi:biopolymer transport protein ExbD